MAADGTQEQGIRRGYANMEASLITLRDWLKPLNATHTAMESVGLYWMPVWNALEDPAFESLLVNPQQLKARQGHKSDQREDSRIFNPEASMS